MQLQKNGLWCLLVLTSKRGFLSSGKKTKLLLQLYLELEDVAENRVQNSIFRICVINNVSEARKSLV